jgi:large subunit ribosomal protein L9
LQKTHKIKVDKRKIELAEPIRSLGYTKVPIKIHSEVTAVLNVHVKEGN